LVTAIRAANGSLLRLQKAGNVSQVYHEGWTCRLPDALVLDHAGRVADDGASVAWLPSPAIAPNTIQAMMPTDSPFP
jgi:hypothetical protein